MSNGLKRKRVVDEQPLCKMRFDELEHMVESLNDPETGDVEKLANLQKLY
jgi:hypothetical protein